MYSFQFHLPTHMPINAAIERDDGRRDVRENMHMTNNLATSCKKRHEEWRKRNKHASLENGLSASGMCCEWM